MKNLVTGGAGYIGGTVAELLLQNCHEAVVFDNLSHGRQDLLPAGVKFVQGELADRCAIEELFITAEQQGRPFEGVLHFAALIEAGELSRSIAAICLLLVPNTPLLRRRSKCLHYPRMR